MAMKLIWLVFVVTTLIYNAIYDFLPDFFQNKSWFRVINIIAALVLLSIAIHEIITSYLAESYAVVSPEGKILERKNFKWNIHKTSEDANPIFIIQERYGDATDINVIPSKPVRFETYNAMDGVSIRFFCKSEEIPQIKIEIKK